MNDRDFPGPLWCIGLGIFAHGDKGRNLGSISTLAQPLPRGRDVLLVVSTTLPVVSRRM